MRVEQFLRDSATRRNDKVALVAGATRLTFAEVDAASDRLAAVLLAGGVNRGDRVIVFMDNCWQAVVGIFAVLKAGAVFCPVNPSTKADKLAFILNNCRASAVLTQARLQDVANAAVVEAPSVVLTVVAGVSDPSDLGGNLSFDEAVGEGTPTALPCPGTETDLAMLIYTSGSTGTPKGVMMTHQNIVAAAGSIATYLENTTNDIVLSVLPISFGYGLYQVLVSAKVGATLVLEKSFAFPQAVLNKMVEEKVTGFPIVPTMAALIMRMKDFDPAALPHLRYITSASANLPPAFIASLRRLFPNADIYSMYGLTECQRGTWLPPHELARRPTSVGIPIPGALAYVIDGQGRRAEPDQVGELVIRGPQVMKGYWDDPAATARALQPGPNPGENVLHTGDLFRSDAEGFLYFVGRMDDIIKTRGEKVSPKEIENVLHALQGVSEAVIVGVDDPVLGTALKAVVVAVPGAGLSEKDVLRYCARHLEDFMVPKLVEFRSELPKTESGKVSRRLVEATLEAAE